MGAGIPLGTSPLITAHKQLGQSWRLPACSQSSWSSPSETECSVPSCQQGQIPPPPVMKEWRRPFQPRRTCLARCASWPRRRKSTNLIFVGCSGAPRAAPFPYGSSPMQSPHPAQGSRLDPFHRTKRPNIRIFPIVPSYASLNVTVVDEGAPPCRPIDARSTTSRSRPPHHHFGNRVGELNAIPPL